MSRKYQEAVVLTNLYLKNKLFLKLRYVNKGAKCFLLVGFINQKIIYRLYLLGCFPTAQLVYIHK